MRGRMGILMALLLVLPAFMPYQKLVAAQGTSPMEQCEQGLILYSEFNYLEAYPLLEAGVANRGAEPDFDPETLANCAMALGLLYRLSGMADEAVDAYLVAVEAAEQSSEPLFARTAYDGLGQAYLGGGDYSDALRAFQAALDLNDREQDPDFEAYGRGLLGQAQYYLGDYTTAQENFEAAYAILMEIGSDDFEMAVALANLGDVYEAQSLYTKARDYYLEALKYQDRVDYPANRCRILGNLAGVYYYLGDLTSAEKMLDDAEQIALQLGTDNSTGAQQMVSVLLRRGLVQDARGDYRQAMDTINRALEMSRQFELTAGEAMALNNLGLVYASTGDYQQAEDTFRSVLKIHRQSDNLSGESIALSNLGVLYRSMGRFEQALEYYQQALNINRNLRSRSNEGTVLNNIGQIYIMTGHYAQAEEALQQALSIAREVQDRQKESMTLNNIAALRAHQGRFKDAEQAYAQALQVLEGQDFPGIVGTIQNNLGELYLLEGKYAPARDALEQALEQARTSGDVELEATAGNNLGEILAATGQLEQAMAADQDALDVAREANLPIMEAETLHDMASIFADQGEYLRAIEMNEAALAIQEKIGDSLGTALTLASLASEHAALGQTEQAGQMLAEALDLFDSIRGEAGSESSRIGFAARFASFYDRAIQLYLKLESPEQAFSVSERGRARAFLDSLATGVVQLNDSGERDLLAQERSAFQQAQEKRLALIQVRSQETPDELLVERLTAELEAAEAAHAAAQEAIAERNDRLAALAPLRSATLELDGVQKLLDEQTTLLSYWVLEDKIVAFVVTSDSFEALELPVSPQALRAEVESLRQFADPSEAHPQSAVQLYAWLIEPLKATLNTPHLAIVPHDILHYLPFAALTDGQRYLVDDYALSYLPSASALQFIRTAQAHTTAEALVMGNPANPDFSPLTHAEQEAETVAELLGGDALLRSAASEQALKAGAAGRGRIHLAAHGRYDPAAPLESYLALAPAGDEDGRLTAGEIYGLDLSAADLVALSACQTQLGELSAGDEVVGLTRAFLFAGTSGVLSSLWKVDDQATTLLMEHFYLGQGQGLGKAEALRQAMLAVREQYANPYYWAAFALNGDAGAVLEMQALKQSAAASTEDSAKGGGGLCGLPLLPLGAGLLFLARRRRNRQPAGSNIEN